MAKKRSIDELSRIISDLEIESKNLKTENKNLIDQLERERKRNAVEKIRLQHFESQYTFAAADLIVNPDPVKVHASFGGRGYDFHLELMKVVAIKAKGRLKEIFLKSPIRPSEGGKLYNPIHLNSDVSDFDGTLIAIQGRSTHLLRVSKSMAVNLYYYDLEDERKLVLNLKKIPKEVEPFRSIKIDSLFSVETFQMRKREIQELTRYIK